MQKHLKNTLLALALASLVAAIFALFFPVQSNFVKGYLDNGRLFTRDWFTYSYEVVGGYLLLIAAASCVYGAVQIYKERSSRAELLFWAFLSVILIVCRYLAGNTLLISWLPGVPAEIQSALGTRYVEHRVAALTNIPQLACSISIIVFAMLTLVFCFSNGGERSESN